MDGIRDSDKAERGRTRQRKDEGAERESSRSRSPTTSSRGRKAAQVASERVTAMYKSECPGGDVHKEDRWMKYQEEGGDLTRDAWEKRYGVVINLAKKGGAFAEEIKKLVAWPNAETELSVYPKGVQRKLDVADQKLKKAIEVKSGKRVDLDDFTRNQVELDNVLKDQGWKIAWYFKGSCSERLRDLLEECGIDIIEHGSPRPTFFDV